MRSKYEQKCIAVYDGIAFETYLTSDYKIGLITEDDKLVNAKEEYDEEHPGKKE